MFRLFQVALLSGVVTAVAAVSSTTAQAGHWRYGGWGYGGYAGGAYYSPGFRATYYLAYRPYTAWGYDGLYPVSPTYGYAYYPNSYYYDPPVYGYYPPAYGFQLRLPGVFVGF